MKTHEPIGSACVLGAGTMGAQIAAHLANAGVKVLLLDIVPPNLPGGGDRSAIAKKGLETASKADPAAFMTPESAALVSVGNLEDDLDKAGKCDWIVEAIVENLDVKRSLFQKLEPHLSEKTIVSSNTSGIPIRSLAEGRSESFRQRFCGTHFFNPPRYMHLLELVPGPATLPAVLERLSRFCDVRLGKGVVTAKDTPNFIANRIGIFGALRALTAFREEGLTQAEVDRITGPLIGRPKSATFRTFDIVGLDVVLHVARNVFDGAPDDERRSVFVPPDWVERMTRSKMLGDKTGQGFYKKVKGEGGESQILALDPQTLEYKPQEKVKLPALEMVGQMEDLGDRLRALVFSSDKVGRFLQKTLLETLVYAAARIPEIADDVHQVDEAMAWGFGWKCGPFETWDMLGVEKTLPLLKARGIPVPPFVASLLTRGHKTFYPEAPSGPRKYVALGDQRPLEPREGVIVLAEKKEQQKVVKRNAGASLIDLGDGVACVEFHSKMNAIGGDTIAMLHSGIEKLSTDFDALVVGNDGENFCVGANLMMLLLEAQEGNFDEIDLIVRQLQKAHMAMKHAPKPVVVAPFGLTLGGGLEVTLHGVAVQALAESYMGLVEVGVGLIPAGGGTKELYLRLLARGLSPFDAVRAAFETIGMAKVGKSAAEARKLGYLREADGISMNRDRLIADAKELALSLSRRGYKPSAPATAIPALGAGGLAAVKVALDHMRRGGFISDYDAHIGLRLGRILTGGDLSHATTVTEERLLDLEREAFLSLCGERRTLERIQHMLKTGKPLRN